MKSLIALLMTVITAVTAPAAQSENIPLREGSVIEAQKDLFDASSVPEYAGKPWVEINGNRPFFEAGIPAESFLELGELDQLGRATGSMACIGKDLMPVGERPGIDPEIKPTGWDQEHYDCIEDNDGFLYQRCHVIGYQLCGDVETPENLYTGTTFINLYSQLEWENMVASYVRQTGNHVLYRVTPVFHGDEMVCRGVLEEALSIEDQGAGICFCVFCYNVQPGITIDYSTGYSYLESTEENRMVKTYVLNTRSRKFHLENCEAVLTISEKNKSVETEKTRDDLIAEGYKPCGMCRP